MGWFTRIDRFGDTHLCFSQEATDSCGLASTKMVVFKVNKLRPGHSSLTTESKVERIYKKYDATAVNVGTEGVFFYMLADVLNEFDIGTWKHVKPLPDQIPKLLTEKLGPDVIGLGAINTIKRGFPILLKVDWGGFSHVVVLDTISKFPFVDACWLSICDPADGDVHITRMDMNQPIIYSGRRVTWSVNVWGTPENNYDQGKTIQGTIVEVVYCDQTP